MDENAVGERQVVAAVHRTVEQGAYLDGGAAPGADLRRRLGVDLHSVELGVRQQPAQRLEVVADVAPELEHRVDPLGTGEHLAEEFLVRSHQVGATVPQRVLAAELARPKTLLRRSSGGIYAQHPKRLSGTRRTAPSRLSDEALTARRDAGRHASAAGARSPRRPTCRATARCRAAEGPAGGTRRSR